jgi:bifunctional non-homologous end joining protein LigD
MPDRKEILEVAGHSVPVSHPDKVYFPRTGHTKLDVVRYYLSVADGALRGVAGRPMVLKRYVNGAEGEPFFQKRAPSSRPDWVETVELSFPSGRTAEEVVVRDAAGLAWVANLGCIDLNRSRGMHIYARIEPRWTFSEVRRAAVALAREIERRHPQDATSRWWKEERHGVFVDYNQNAKDRTVASAYSVRPTPDARVSAPLAWDEVPDCRPETFTIDTMPERFARLGDLVAGIDAATGSLEPLLERAARDEAAGLPDAPWPPHFVRQAGEEPRVQPSKRRAPGKASGATGRRRSSMPLIEVARAATKAGAMAGLDRWKQRHPEVWAKLDPADVLVDSMRGRSSTWTRIRLNLRNVAEAERPEQEPLEVDYNPWARGSGS